MLRAKTVEGKELESAIQELFDNVKIDYIQVHNASPGCYNCQANRVNNHLLKI